MNAPMKNLMLYLNQSNRPFQLKFIALFALSSFWAHSKLSLQYYDCFYSLFLTTFYHYFVVFQTQRAFKSWAQHFTRPIIRLALFSMGIVKINFKGKPHPDIRTYVGNHLSLVETVVMIYEFPISYLAASYLSTNPFIRGVDKIFDFIFVNRSSKGADHISQVISNVQNDPYHLPLLVFPEGKVTNGHACIGFSTGAFLSDTPLQPFSIRFRQWFCPKSMATISWLIDPFWKWAFQAFSVPFYTVEVELLPPIILKGDNQSPAERAKEAQLAICNNLGIYAYSKTNKDFFEKHKIQ